MSDRPPPSSFPYDTFVREPEITDSEEAVYSTQETPVDPNRRLPDESDHDEEEQEVHPSEEEQQIDEAPLNQDRPQQEDNKSNGDQQPEKLVNEGDLEDGGITPPANAMADKKGETSQKVDTKSEMRSGMKRSANIVHGPEDEKPSVPPAVPTEVPPHGDPEGSSTRGGEQGK